MRSAGPDGARSRRLGKPAKRFNQLAAREWSFWRYPRWPAVLRNFAEGDLFDTYGNITRRIAQWAEHPANHLVEYGERSIGELSFHLSGEGHQGSKPPLIIEAVEMWALRIAVPGR